MCGTDFDMYLKPTYFIDSDHPNIIAFAKEGDLHGLGYIYLYRKNTINWLFDFVEEEFMFIDLL